MRGMTCVTCCRMRTGLTAVMTGLGRAGWMREEMERFSTAGVYEPDPALAYLRLRGPRSGFTRRPTALLRGLAAWREREAADRDVPARTLLPGRSPDRTCAAAATAVDRFRPPACFPCGGGCVARPRNPEGARRGAGAGPRISFRHRWRAVGTTRRPWSAPRAICFMRLGRRCASAVIWHPNWLFPRPTRSCWPVAVRKRHCFPAGVRTHSERSFAGSRAGRPAPWSASDRNGPQVTLQPAGKRLFVGGLTGRQQDVQSPRSQRSRLRCLRAPHNKKKDALSTALGRTGTRHQPLTFAIPSSTTANVTPSTSRFVVYSRTFRADFCLL